MLEMYFFENFCNFSRSQECIEKAGDQQTVAVTFYQGRTLETS